MNDISIDEWQQSLFFIQDCLLFIAAVLLAGFLSYSFLKVKKKK